MQILWINNDGGGFADYIEITEGTTVAQFFNQQLPDRQPEDYLIRVNRQPVPRNYVIQPGDRVSMTPTKIEGAVAAQPPRITTTWGVVAHPRRAPHFLFMENEMDPHQKHLLRTAAAIQVHLQRQPQPSFTEADSQIMRLCIRFQGLERLRKRLTLCRQRGWNLAGQQLLQDLHDLLLDLDQVIAPGLRIPPQRAEMSPTLRQLYEELNQIEQEFEDVEFRRDESVLAAKTEPIELEGVYLGPFEIRMHLNRLRNPNYNEALRIVALEPNRAAGHEEVTHPHVSDQRLCAGDAGAALQNALRFGRLCDAFLLTRAVLETYNPDSPFVPLRRWNGVTCYECGSINDPDDVFYCEGCDEDYCDECIDRCQVCDTNRCRGCLIQCSQCEEYICAKCRETCRSCSKPICPDCLEDGLCSDCSEKENSNDDDHDEQPQPAGAAIGDERPLDTRTFATTQ